MIIRGIHYHVDIYSEGEPLILLHGFTGSSLNWKHLLKEFSNYQLVLIDLIGHGGTDCPEDPSRYKMEEVVEDLVCIFDELKIEKANVLGYSMGGRLALSFACIYPDRINKLIVESSSPGLQRADEREKRRQADEKLADEIISGGMERFVDKWESIPLFATQARLPFQQRNVIRQLRLQNSSLGLANSLIGMGTGAQPAWWDVLPNLNVPVLLLCGELDQKFCDIAKSMDQLLSKSVVNEINGTGHAIHVEQPRIFGKIVNEFLKSDFK
ncbi:2-succinyl-6-hydroxy-2,4-cyclohexadiene-1-carboxylate synthase [Metabacillus rhizolycopersici]|uniref:Putative 2-succinyl-6-hydroxy-2,4-cyclohexadiene-1-carboxylate synthase n=1 Tax=Metabacillus rhizolycopersici TaxID=2875709 RepID=A0ABS7UUK5_9BACI|nr:2-succinyl-6-hydroxy-2,4-cyclohexadiene-1-carboxylate synthase [Metabacillus rhizolycopersici]MBZ5751599.1 2-succinyl-6-hydroxy-2,4-cyclohexadiene-1-carboxylate synthase [Metabacillus rhizolycopersici]